MLAFARHLLLLAGLGAVNSVAFAATQTATDWFALAGAPALDKTDPTAPVVGTGAPRSANNAAVAGAFPGITLDRAGQFAEITGTMEIHGGAVGSHGQVRFGLFDVNGMPGNIGWLGYYAYNASGPSATQLAKRNPRNKTIAITGYGDAAGLTLVGPSVKTAEVFRPGVGKPYDFSVRYTREPDNALTIDWSLTLQGGGYAVKGAYTDKTPNTYTFNRAAFLFGSSLAANKVNFSKVILTYGPETGSDAPVAPGSDVPPAPGNDATGVSGKQGLMIGAGVLVGVGLLGGVAGVVIVRRRRRAAPVIPPPEIAPPSEEPLPPPPGAE